MISIGTENIEELDSEKDFLYKQIEEIERSLKPSYEDMVELKRNYDRYQRSVDSSRLIIGLNELRLQKSGLIEKSRAHFAELQDYQAATAELADEISRGRLK